MNYVVSNSELFLVRLRDEGHRVTFTTKRKHPSGFSEENEIIVNSFEDTRQLLASLGYQEKDFYEKLREIWYNKECEVVFDTMPVGVELMEIECQNESHLNKYEKLLDVGGLRVDIGETLSRAY